MSQPEQFFRVLTLLVLGLLVSVLSAVAADYRIGPGDMLEVKFWPDQESNAVVAVSQDGKIALPIIGQVAAAGKTAEQLQGDILSKISRLNSRISKAVVNVTQYNYNYLFVTGQVVAPGRLSFEEIPSLWTIINEAGGPTEFGDLTRVTIIRGGEKAGSVEVIDVAKAIAEGKQDELPEIRREDTIEIPSGPAGLPPLSLSETVQQKNFFYVVGAVGTPGPVQFQDNIDILDAVALAGGHTEAADLKKARVLSKDGNYAQSMHIDLEKYSKTGQPARYIIRREDTIILPYRGNPFLSLNIGMVVTVVGLVTSFLIIYDQLKPVDAQDPFVVP